MKVQFEVSSLGRGEIPHWWLQSTKVVRPRAGEIPAPTVTVRMIKELIKRFYIVISPRSLFGAYFLQRTALKIIF